MSNEDLLRIATESLQAQERLHLELRKANAPGQKQYRYDEAFKKSSEVLDRLREIKAEIEGSNFNFETITINDHPLLELRQLTLMHIPESVTDIVKSKFWELVSQTFHGRCERILSVILMTCPWYRAVQRERGEQARYNVLLVVYMAHDHQILSPVNSHIMDQNNVIDKGWLCAVELFHFANFLVKGKSQFVEALYCPEGALLHSSPEWKEIRETLPYKDVMGLRGFVEQCRGQATGNVAKKGKDGKMRLTGGATFHNLCDSFRLLHHAHNTARGLPPHTGVLDVTDLPALAQEAEGKLKALYQDPDVSRQDLFLILLKWKEEINVELSRFSYIKYNEAERVVGSWMARTRLRVRELRPATYVADDFSCLTQLMEIVGGPVTKMKPEQILLIARAGSHLYGLSTPDSDMDYMVIYAEPTQSILSSCKRLNENFENRGPSKTLEYGAYEARLFCEMLLKGSVVILELVFAETLDYMSSFWKELASQRQLFVTEKGIQQFLGLIKNNFNLIRSDKHKGTGRDRKLFYQIFHKLYSLGYFLLGKPPPVVCSGDTKQFIMKIRLEPLEGDLSRDVLYQKALMDYEQLREKLANRKSRLPENADYRHVSKWLMTVRGILGD